MNCRKTALAVGLIMLVGIPMAGQTDFVTEERSISYQIEFQRIRWYERLYVLVFGGYEFLKWEEIYIKEFTIKDPVNQSGEIVILTVAPKNHKEIAYLKNAGEKIWGFVNFINYKEYQKEQVLTLMAVYNYLYQAREGQSEFIVPNLFEKTEGDKISKMRMTITKKKIKDKYLIQITAFDEQKKLSFIEALMSPQPPKTFENITISLEKEKVRVVLIQKPAK